MTHAGNLPNVPAVPEPHRIQLRRRPLVPAAYLQRGAQESDYHTLLTDSTIVEDADEQRVRIVYLAQIAEDTTTLVDALRHVKITWGKRTGGMRSRSRTFGYRPRNARHDDFCSATGLAREDPAAHLLLCQWAEVVARYYRLYGPDIYAQHLRATQSVLPAWALEGTPFTSGIVNRDNPLPFHYDGGNIRDVWSNMLGLKRGVRGGYLAVPEYDVAFEIGDGSLLLFDGQRLLHGVTPFTVAPEGYRFTVVFYSRQQMWRCLPPREELARIQRRTAKRDR